MNTEAKTDVADLENEEKPKLDLTIKINKTSACERHVTVSIPRADIDRYFAEKFDKLAPEAEVPGFRAGKAPRQLVESRFRPYVQDQVKGALLMDALAQISDESDFSAISEPDFDYESIRIPDEGPMTWEFNIEVRPEFDLPKWKGLTLTRTARDISDADVDAEIQRHFSRNVDLVPVDEPAQEGDIVVCNITSSHDGRELQSVEEEMVEVRPVLNLGDATISDFGKQMIGASSGDSRTFTVTISEFADNEEFRGKELEVRFDVLDVKRPEGVNVEQLEEQFSSVGEGGLRGLVRSNLEMQNDYRQRQEIRQQISALLTESAEWELPRDLLRRQMRRELDRAVMELSSSGFSESEIRNQENLLRQDAMRRTEVLLKEHFILERIAEEENIEETDEDFDLEIARIAMQRNDSPRRVRARLERAGQMDSLRNMIIEQKVINLIKEHASFRDVKAKRGEAAAAATAVDFFAAGGRPGESIPDAKYDDSGEQQVPQPRREID